MNRQTESSEQSQTPEALYEQRQWLQVTLSSIGDAVITTDSKGNVTFLNPVAQSLTGWTPEEAARTPIDNALKRRASITIWSSPSIRKNLKNS
jgi:PAS domain-containing protein